MAGPPRNFASLLRARRGYLGAIGGDGSPRVVPVCFTWAGDVVWAAIDGEKEAGASSASIPFLEQNPKVSFMVDRWDEDWRRLAWLQAQGTASVLMRGAEVERAREALEDKYPQYAETPPKGPVIRIDIRKWTGWSSGPPA